MWLLRRVGGLCCTADLYRDEADVWYSSRIQLEIDYEPGEKLGEGSYAVVRAVRRPAVASLLVRDTTSGWCFVARGTALGQGALILLLFTPKKTYVGGFRHPYSVQGYLSGRPEGPCGRPTRLT